MQVSILGLLLCKPVLRLIGYYPFTDGEGSKMNCLERTEIAATAKLHSEFWRNTSPGKIFKNQILEMFILLQNFSPLMPSLFYVLPERSPCLFLSGYVKSCLVAMFKLP